MNPLAAIHVKKKQLGLDDDTYRDLLERVTGERSAAKLSHSQQLEVVAEMDRQGAAAAPVAKGSRRRLEGRFAKKLQALWIAAWNLGLVRDRTDEALVSFVKRQTGIDHVRFLHDDADARKAIEALKGWMARAGGVERKLRPDHDFLRHECGNIAWAQFRMLVPGATLVGNTAMFRAEVMRAADARADAPLGLLGDADWRRVMNAFGKRVRSLRA